MKDLYKVLGVSRDADSKAIKSAYRRLAKELHPDANPDDPRVADRFKDVSAAYAVLGDPKQRARYDAGELDARARARGAGANADAGAAGGEAGRKGWSFNFGGGEGFSDFGDIFENLRGGGSSRAGRREATRGADKTYRITVGFLDAARGARRRVNLPGGRSLNVGIPAGIEHGRQIRLRGQGEPAPPGGEAGDALVEVRIEPHRFFERDGLDVRMNLPITLLEAVRGARITVPTIDGSVSLSVPANSSSGKVMRLKGRGIARKDGERGDQYVTLQIRLPDSEDEALVQAIEKWSKRNDYRVRTDKGYPL